MPVRATVETPAVLEDDRDETFDVGVTTAELSEQKRERKSGR